MQESKIEYYLLIRVLVFGGILTKYILNTHTHTRRYNILLELFQYRSILFT